MEFLDLKLIVSKRKQILNLGLLELTKNMQNSFVLREILCTFQMLSLTALSKIN